MGADPEEPAEDIGDVAAEHAPIRMQLVDDDDAELFEQLVPLRVVGEDGGVEHVGVRHDDLAGASHGLTDCGRSVAVVGGCRDVQPGSLGQLRKLRDLVLAEGLRREEVEGSRGRVLGDRLERRQDVAEGLARGRRRDNDDVVAVVRGRDRLGLMRVEPIYATSAEAAHDARVEPLRYGREGRLAGWSNRMVDDPARDRRLGEEALENRLHGRRGIRAHGLTS